MTQQRKKVRRRKTAINPADIRSWDNENHRMEGRDLFKLNTPYLSTERQKCIDSGVHAKTKFAEWGLFYIEGQKDPPDFPIFDPTWKKTKIPSATVFSVYEERKYRPKRDETVVFVLPIKGVTPEKMDQIWRCTYTPYIGKKKKKNASSG